MAARARAVPEGLGLPAWWPHRARSNAIEAGNLGWHVQTFGKDDGFGPTPRPVALLLHGTGSDWMPFVAAPGTPARLAVPRRRTRPSGSRPHAHTRQPGAEPRPARPGGAGRSAGLVVLGVCHWCWPIPARCGGRDPHGARRSHRARSHRFDQRRDPALAGCRGTCLPAPCEADGGHRLGAPCLCRVERAATHDPPLAGEHGLTHRRPGRALLRPSAARPASCGGCPQVDGILGPALAGAGVVLACARRCCWSVAPTTGRWRRRTLRAWPGSSAARGR